MAMQFGPGLNGNAATFHLWAPTARSVALQLRGAETVPMQQAEDGFWHIEAPAAAGQAYRFITDGQTVPDPASRQQAGDVQDWSVVCPPLPPGPADAIRPWHEALIAEVHVGTATPEGTFNALRERLPYFQQAGYTVVELMPVADYAGRRNWGYDGVLPYAPDSRYGTPAELRALVDAAHALGLGVMLDVVYNHFGPEGNFLHGYAESFFTDRFTTPWGAAIDFSQKPVRQFFCQNAQMWLGEFGFDGLRFDAVHALFGDAADQFLAELAAACRTTKPHAWLVLENDRNEARHLQRPSSSSPQQFDAQWNDDLHHVLHILATGETNGYYKDYAEDVLAATGRALTEGFVFQGEPSAFRDGAKRGEPSAMLPPTAFVSFVQNHDQIGNRPLGDRMEGRVSPARMALLRFMQLLLPQVPLLFMGEEAGITTPFPFFCDFEGPLADAVRSGRKEEFKDFFAAHGEAAQPLPDPLAASTFTAARLPWQAGGLAGDAAVYRRFLELARLRREVVWPLLTSSFSHGTVARHGEALLVRWFFGAGQLVMAINPSEAPVTLPAPAEAPFAREGSVSTGGDFALGSWSGAAWVLPAHATA